jgi:Cu+-exporting ATPase
MFGVKLQIKATIYGAVATLVLLSLYLLVLTLVSGWSFTVKQFVEFWPYVVSLAVGFGIQIALYVYLKNLVHNGGATRNVVAVSGTTSTAAMISCCTHYLVNILPVLGATGLVTFVSQYQVGLFWFGIVSNLAGIAYIGRKVIQIKKLHE